MSLKELDKFVKHFVLKSVQVIVQSRLGSPRIATQCNPYGNDWFNLAINDIKDINEQTKKCLEMIGAESDDQLNGDALAISHEWKVCCEISVKTNEGDSLILEYWFITNQPNDTTRDETKKAPEGSQINIYTVYNRMSLMLKSLITLTRATPAYKLSYRGQSAESYVICYRVYHCDYANDMFKNGDDESHFTCCTQLGSIKSSHNELTVNFTYRTDMTFGCKSTPIDNGTELLKSPQLLPLKKDHFKSEERKTDDRNSNKPLIAAFANSNSEPSLLPLLPEAPFSSLLHRDNSNDSLHKIKKDDIIAVPLKSDPIFIPSKGPPLKNSPSSPVYSSSGDSFVFVELKTPFAPEEHHELGSFFNGPSPAFTGSVGADSNGDISELTVQLAEMESNAHQWDSFVDSICCDVNDDDENDGKN